MLLIKIKPLVLADDFDPLGTRSRHHEDVVVPIPGISKIVAPAKNNIKLTHRTTDVWLTGRWRGMYMGTVYMEELATCQTNGCPPEVREICFAHLTVNATRFAWCSTFFPALDSCLEVLQHRWREGFTIDLHSTGDFADEDHFEGWVERMDRYPAMVLWGNTAYPNPDIAESVRIGRRIDELNERRRDRFAIRMSGREGDMGSSILGVTTTAERARGKFVCPAPKVCCAECAFCVDSTDGLVRPRH